MIDRMVTAGAKASDIRVVLGPCIGACCFEVGDEVTAEFKTTMGSLDGMVVNGPKKEHVDLRIVLAHAVGAKRSGSKFH